MKNRSTAASKRLPTIPKAPTGIQGLDEITGGGLPAGRPTLICGSAGAGKTMLGMEFLVRGATQFNEPGVFLMFEESAEELTANVRSLGFDLKKLIGQKQLLLDYVRLERDEIEESGEYSLDGLFVRLGYAIDAIGAKRVVLDTLEALFVGLPNPTILRAELQRLFRWLKARGVTAVITGERGDEALTRYGLEEFVADCVIVLDHRIEDQVSTRRLRVVKYRGSAHGTNEYPFLISAHGISVLPITSLRLDHSVSNQRISTGIPRLDEMFGGKGVYVGSSVLVSGSPGSGKSSIGASFLYAACRRGERAMLFAYEESSDQIMRNMRSIGIDLSGCVKKGLLEIHASRPTLYGLEQHLVQMTDTIQAFNPTAVVIDPISNLAVEPNSISVKPTLMRLIDFLKQRHITALFTSLTENDATLDNSQIGVSSLMDTWLSLRNIEENGERNRLLYVLKSRGMAHSNQVREFVLTEHGIDLIDVYLDAERVLIGTARVVKESEERNALGLRRQEQERRLRQIAVKRKALEAQIASLQAAAAAEDVEINLDIAQETQRADTAIQDAQSIARRRTGVASKRINTDTKKGKGR